MNYRYYTASGQCMVTPTEWKTCYDVRTYVHTTVTTCSGHFCVIPQLTDQFLCWRIIPDRLFCAPRICRQ